jgi:hypothetical protein
MSQVLSNVVRPSRIREDKQAQLPGWQWMLIALGVALQVGLFAGVGAATYLLWQRFVA